MNREFYLLNDTVSKTISPENPTGEKGCGAMAEPLPNSAGERLGKGWKSRPFIVIPPKSTYTIVDIVGEGEIKSIWLTGEVDQGAIIRMYWDDQVNPSVESTLTEFFLYGFAPPFNIAENTWNKGPLYKVNSALMAVNPNRGFNCYIPMPFRKRAIITIENRTTNPKTIYFQVNYEEKNIPKEAGYFHANLRLSMPVPYKGVHTIIDGIEGKGSYIGTALYVGLNRASRWWGEGEFKFYMDDDKDYPSVCTTGLEDYFCGAFHWDTESEYCTYNSLYAGMPHITKPNGLYEIQQRFNLYRWHVVDPIRFEKNLKVTVQDLGWIKNDEGKWSHFLPREDDFISVAYWYQELPTAPFPELIDHETLIERF